MTANPEARTRRARGSLSSEQILDAARELVETNGLDALSMPILARKLDAGVTSLYWYFRNKEDLLVALAEQVTLELYATLSEMGGGPWDDELRAHFVEYRRVLGRFPVYLELHAIRPRFVMTRPQVLAIVLKQLDQDIALLVRAGLPLAEAARSYSACTQYTRGFVMLELGLAHEREEQADGLHEWVIETVEHLDSGSYPALRALGDLDPVTELGDRAFESGLDVMIDGIRTQVPTGGRARTARRRKSS